MGLFEKKFCCICGEKIGLLGNRRLEDGNLCKQCTAKLSPWFSDRRQSTVEQIRSQLVYREENQVKAAAFACTRSFGSGMKVLLDDNAGLFTVTRARDLAEANPDVLSLGDVTGCTITPREHKTEVRFLNDEKQYQSYEPKRYEYSYDIAVTILVNNPWFDEMHFDVNSSRIDIGEPGFGLDGLQKQPQPMLNEVYRAQMETAQQIRFALTGIAPDAEEPFPVYAVAEEEISEFQQPAEAPVAVVCPACGASVTPDAAGFCPCCGTKLSTDR